MVHGSDFENSLKNVWEADKEAFEHAGERLGTWATSDKGRKIIALGANLAVNAGCDALTAGTGAAVCAVAGGTLADALDTQLQHGLKSDVRHKTVDMNDVAKATRNQNRHSPYVPNVFRKHHGYVEEEQMRPKPQQHGKDRNRTRKNITSHEAQHHIGDHHTPVNAVHRAMYHGDIAYHTRPHNDHVTLTGNPQLRTSGHVRLPVRR